MQGNVKKQAGAELCQAKDSYFANNLLGDGLVVKTYAQLTRIKREIQKTSWG